MATAEERRIDEMLDKLAQLSADEVMKLLRT
jgi:hypothetical protein